MDQLASIRAFVTVVDAGGFARAGRRLGRSTATVTRQVQDLEARLGVRLLARTTRRVAPTGTGLEYLQRCRRILEELEEADALASREAMEPRGVLRVSAPLSFAWHRLGGLLPGLLAAHPQLALELTLSDRFVDLTQEGFDAAIRVGRLVDSALLSRRLGSERLWLVAAPAYLQRHGTPRRPEDLSHHECLCYSQMGAGRRNTWTFRRDARPVRVTVTGRYEVNNGDLIRDAAMAGLGIAYQPGFLLGDTVERGHLVRVLPDYDGDDIGVHAVYPQRAHLSARLRVFLDYLQARLQGGPGASPRPGAEPAP